MEQPLVSVVLCSFNGKNFIAQQVDSILAQTWHPLELIISDDASTDGTKEILAGYSHRDNVTILYQEKNMGLTRNFEIASQKARGQLIAFSDQDDIWKNNKIETLVRNINDYPLVYSDSLLVDEQGNGMNKKLSDLKKMYTGTDSRGYILYSCVWGHGMMITKDLLNKCMPLPEGVHHDIWIAFQAFLNGGIKYHDEVLTFYRQHPHSTSQTLPEKNTIRKKKSKYEAYLEKLHWIELMHQHERPGYREFYNELLRLYREKKNTSYVFPLVPFMLKYRKEIFMYSKKGFASQLVEILKQARGERK